MSVLGHRLRAYVAPSGFNPLTAFTWTAVYWANDPGWSNPGNGNAVTTWSDGSGNGYTATNDFGTTTFRSTEADLNNKAVVEFISTARMQSANFSAALSQPYSFVVIGADKVGSSSWARILVAGAHQVNGRLLKRGTGTVGVSLDAGVYASAATGGLADTGGFLLSGVFNGASSAVALNGTVAASDTPGTGTAAKASLNADSDSLSGAVDGKFALAGIMSGDVHAHGNYSAFKSWVASYYGLIIA